MSPTGIPQPARLRVLPSLEELTAGLARVFDVAESGLVVSDRRSNLYATSVCSEVVMCRCADGNERALFVKHGSGARLDGNGHRGGAAYEALVHREVLGKLDMSTPAFFGAFVREAGGVSLVFASLAQAVRVGMSVYPDAMRLAAGWIGGFHRRSALLLEDESVSLTRYDLRYFLGWVTRAARLADAKRREAWLGRLCREAADVLPTLLREPPCVIHGEYYQSNVLFLDGGVHPVDWETAAIAAGEIDLAALTDNWPAPVVAECELAYAASRWPEGAPDAFARTLDVARLYLHLRWLGDRPEWTTGAKADARYERLRSVGERLGLIAG